jgi:hypothetical protein
MPKNTMWLIFVITGVCSCRNKTIHLFISNESTEDSVVQLELFINKQKKLDQAFRYTQVIPDYDNFEFTVPQTADSIVLDMKTNTGVVKSNVSVPANENYIFIAYSYKLATDSVIKPRDLITATYKKMPQIE